MIDPWGGSFYVERLTHELAGRAWTHIREVEELGGMTRAIEASLPPTMLSTARGGAANDAEAMVAPWMPSRPVLEPK